MKENNALDQTLSTKTCDQHNGLQEPVQCNKSLRNNNDMKHKVRMVIQLCSVNQFTMFPFTISMHNLKETSKSVLKTSISIVLYFHNLCKLHFQTILFYYIKNSIKLLLINTFKF